MAVTGLRLGACMGVMIVVVPSVGAQPADPSTSTSADAGVPDASPPAADAAPPPSPSPRATVPSPAVPAPSAAPPRTERYPIELVDRPLVMPSGVTRFDPSMQFRTHVQETVDASGDSTYKRTGFFENRTPDLSLSHVFGPVQVGVGVGIFFNAYATMLVSSLPLSVGLNASFGVVQLDSSYFHSQTIGATYKHLAVPHRLAIVGKLSASLEEVRAIYSGVAVEGLNTDGTASISGIVQLARHWSVYVGARTTAPIYKTADFNVSVNAGASAGVQLTFRKWDFFIDTAMGLDRHPSTFLNIGFSKRWGL
jgi:hypothetical protein